MPAHPIRFGIQTGQQGVGWPEMLDLRQKADARGYDSLWRFTKAGVTHFIFMTFAPFFLDEMQGFAEEVVPAVR
jgi:hypothetical protein